MEGNVKAAKNRIQKQDFRNSKTSSMSYYALFSIAQKRQRKNFSEHSPIDHTASSESIFLS